MNSVLLEEYSKYINFFFLLLNILILCVDDMNWNALEWDRAAEELTWERVSMAYTFRNIFSL